MTRTSERHHELLRASRPSEAARRFAGELVRRQTELAHPGLIDAVAGEPLCRVERYGDELRTVSFRQRQLPMRYLRAVFGFRLAQFLRAGLVDPELVYRRAMRHEPVDAPAGPDPIHTVTLTEAGRLVGYIGLVGSPDPRPLALDSLERARFPVEVAHHIDLLSGFAERDRTTHNVYEIKRFVRDHAMARGAQRDRVSWHLLLAIVTVGFTVGEEIQVVAGDAAEHGALRYLRLMEPGFAVVEGTTPSLAPSELMWPSYLAPPERRAKPFVGLVPGCLGEYREAIEAALRLPSEPEWLRNAIVCVQGTHERAAAA